MNRKIEFALPSSSLYHFLQSSANWNEWQKCIYSLSESELRSTQKQQSIGKLCFFPRKKNFFNFSFAESAVFTLKNRTGMQGNEGRRRKIDWNPITFSVWNRISCSKNFFVPSMSDTSSDMFVLDFRFAYDLNENHFVLRASKTNSWSRGLSRVKMCWFSLDFVFVSPKSEKSCNFIRFFIKHARKRAEKIVFYFAFFYKLMRRFLMGKNLQLLWPSKRRHSTPRRRRIEIKAMCNNSSYSVALFAKAFCCVDVYLLRQLINWDFIEALRFQIFQHSF